MRQILKVESTNRLWELEQTSLSHEPGDKMSAAKMSNRFGQLFDDWKRVYIIAAGGEVKPNKDEEDGVMRVVE